MEQAKLLRWPFLLRQLSLMIESGLPIERAINSLISSSGKLKHKLSKASRLINKGLSLPKAFYQTGLIKNFDYAMLSSADTSGRLHEGLLHISERRVNQLQRVDALRSALVLPKALVILGAVAALFVRTATGQQSMTESIISVSIIVTLFYALVMIGISLVRLDTRVWMSCFWPYPWVRQSISWYRLSLEYLLYNSLMWQISSGVSASQAAKNCSQILDSGKFQRRMLSAAKSMDNGERMTQALTEQGLVLTERMRQVVLIADQSGTHEQAIKHELAIQRSALKLKADNFFKWAPRVAYLIALIFVSKLLAS